jgi:hypothetical protein
VNGGDGGAALFVAGTFVPNGQGANGTNYETNNGHGFTGGHGGNNRNGSRGGGAAGGAGGIPADGAASAGSKGGDGSLIIYRVF